MEYCSDIKKNTFEPVLMRCMKQGAEGWSTGMTLRHGMGRGVQDAEHMYIHG